MPATQEPEGSLRSYKPEYADGEQMRDFVYVRDAVDVTLSFLEKGSASGLFNCGTGKARTWKLSILVPIAWYRNTPTITKGWKSP